MKLTTLTAENDSSLPSVTVLFSNGFEWGVRGGTDVRFRLTTSPEARRVMTAGGREVMASPRIGDSGDEDEVRVQMRYSAELVWLRSFKGGKSGKTCKSSQIITDLRIM